MAHAPFLSSTSAPSKRELWRLQLLPCSRRSLIGSCRWNLAAGITPPIRAQRLWARFSSSSRRSWISFAAISQSKRISLTKDEVLDLRVNRNFARRAAALYSRENLASLSAQGLVPTFGHLRLAFLVGPAAAVRLIKATPDTPTAEVLGTGVIRPTHS